MSKTQYVGVIIRKWRLGNGWKIRFLAQKVQEDERNLGKYERGVLNTPFELIKRLIALGCPIPLSDVDLTPDAPQNAPESKTAPPTITDRYIARLEKQNDELFNTVLRHCAEINQKIDTLRPMSREKNKHLADGQH